MDFTNLMDTILNLRGKNTATVKARSFNAKCRVRKDDLFRLMSTNIMLKNDDVIIAVYYTHTYIYIHT